MKYTTTALATEFVYRDFHRVEEFKLPPQSLGYVGALKNIINKIVITNVSFLVVFVLNLAATIVFFILFSEKAHQSLVYLIIGDSLVCFLFLATSLAHFSRLYNYWIDITRINASIRPIFIQQVAFLISIAWLILKLTFLIINYTHTPAYDSTKFCQPTNTNELCALAALTQHYFLIDIIITSVFIALTIILFIPTQYFALQLSELRFSIWRQFALFLNPAIHHNQIWYIKSRSLYPATDAQTNLKTK